MTQATVCMSVVPSTEGWEKCHLTRIKFKARTSLGISSEKTCKNNGVRVVRHGLQELEAGVKKKPKKYIGTWGKLYYQKIGRHREEQSCKGYSNKVTKSRLQFHGLGCN